MLGIEELNLGPLQEQLMLLTAEPSLQSKKCYLLSPNEIIVTYIISVPIISFPLWNQIKLKRKFLWGVKRGGFGL